MSCLTIGAWHEVFYQHSTMPGDVGQMATVLTQITSIVGDPCYTPMRKIELLERMFDDMALRALETNDGTG